MTTSQNARRQRRRALDDQKFMVYLTMQLLVVAVATFVVSLAMFFVMLVLH